MVLQADVTPDTMLYTAKKCPQILLKTDCGLFTAVGPSYALTVDPHFQTFIDTSGSPQIGWISELVANLFSYEGRNGVHIVQNRKGDFGHELKLRPVHESRHNGSLF